MMTVPMTAGLLLSTVSATPVRDVEKARYFNQTFDHFNAEGPKGTWQQR